VDAEHVTATNIINGTTIPQPGIDDDAKDPVPDNDPEFLVDFGADGFGSWGTLEAVLAGTTNTVTAGGVPITVEMTSAGFYVGYTSDINDPVFTLEILPDTDADDWTNYDFQLYQRIDTDVTRDVVGDFDNVKAGNTTGEYWLDMDTPIVGGDGQGTYLKILAYDENDVPAPVNTNSGYIGVDSNWTGDGGESIKMFFFQLSGQDTSPADGLGDIQEQKTGTEFMFDYQLQGNAPATFTWAALDINGDPINDPAATGTVTTSAGTGSVGADGDFTVPYDGTYYGVELTVTEGEMRFSNPAATVSFTLDNLDIELQLETFDGDGDSTTVMLPITIEGGTTQTTTQATAEASSALDNPLVFDSSGDDVLTGSSGSDTYYMQGGNDVIADYSQDEGDVIDLSDLIDIGSGKDLSDYVSVTAADDGSAQIVLQDHNGKESGDTITLNSISYGDLTGGSVSELDALLALTSINIDGNTF